MARGCSNSHSTFASNRVRVQTKSGPSGPLSTSDLSLNSACSCFCQRKLLDFGLPHRKQRTANQYERETKAEPHANGSHLQLKAKKRTQRKTNYPVADEIGQHGNAGVAGASERSGGNNL